MIDIRDHRPASYSETEVESLFQSANALLSLLLDTQKHFTHKTLKLSLKQLEELSLIIVEFAEDVINEIGILIFPLNNLFQ